MLIWGFWNFPICYLSFLCNIYGITCRFMFHDSSLVFISNYMVPLKLMHRWKNWKKLTKHMIFKFSHFSWRQQTYRYACLMNLTFRVLFGRIPFHLYRKTSFGIGFLYPTLGLYDCSRVLWYLNFLIFREGWSANLIGMPFFNAMH